MQVNDYIQAKKITEANMCYFDPNREHYLVINISEDGDLTLQKIDYTEDPRILAIPVLVRCFDARKFKVVH